MNRFDIVIWGASSFTGKLVTEYFFKNFTSNKIKWAIAGRNKSKLEKVVNELDKSKNQKHKFLEVDFSNYNLFLKSIKSYFSSHFLRLSSRKNTELEITVTWATWLRF